MYGEGRGVEGGREGGGKGFEIARRVFEGRSFVFIEKEIKRMRKSRDKKSEGMGRGGKGRENGMGGRVI